MESTKKILICLLSLTLCVGVSCRSRTNNQKLVQEKAAAMKISTKGGKYSQAGENKNWTISLGTKYQDEIDLTVIHKFTLKNYSYFLTTERKTAMPGSPYISKIKRVCYTPGKSIADEYSEILIKCASKNESYDLVQAAHVGKPGLNLMRSLNITSEDEVLFATFSKNKTNNSNETTADSAMCIYSVDMINKKFAEKIQNCFNNMPNVGLDLILSEKKCIGTMSTVDIDTECIRGVKNVPYDGNEPIISSPLSTFTAHPTAIMSARKENYTVIFIGTSDGYLKTYIVNETESLAFSYNVSWEKENSSVNFDSQLSTDEIIVFEKAIRINGSTNIKVPEIPCGIFTTYDSCLQSDIKKCGWCGMSNLCTKKLDCKQEQKDGIWLDYDFRKKISIDINSFSFERTSDESIKMNITGTPPISLQLYCSFEIRNEIYITSPTWHPPYASCPAPSHNKISKLPLDYDRLNATLQIKTNHFPNIVSINVTFFDCRTYDSCDKCISSLKCVWHIECRMCRPRHQMEWKNNKENIVIHKSQVDNLNYCPPMSTSLKPNVDSYDKCILSCEKCKCGWCVKSNECTFKNDCSNATDLSWINYQIRPFFSIHSNQTNFSISILHHKYLQSERSKALQLSLHAPQLNITKDEFYCKITFECFDSSFITNATFSKTTHSNYTVMCETPILYEKLTIPSFNYSIKANLAIKLANFPDICNTSIIFFNCTSYNSLEACSSSTFECQWCPDEGICTFIATNPCKVNTNTCLNSTPPSISSIKPVQGPWEGGTNLTILGENLGCTCGDISHSIIKVAGVPCTPLIEKCIPMKKIVCNINRSNSYQNLEGPVALQLNKNLLMSHQNFKFVTTKISGISPKEGFSYGGTELTIKGEHLDAGRFVEISVGNASCPLIYRLSNEMKCITSPSMTEENEIIVKFDKNICKANSSSYKYVKDPERDENGFNLVPKGILSGGVEILIRGIKFTGESSTPKLQFQVHFNKNYYNSSCTVRNDSTATCQSPRIPDIGHVHTAFIAQNPLELEYSLKHQPANVRLTFHTYNNSMKFTLYPDPEFFYFLNSSVEFDEKTYAIIKGRNINLACQKSDIKVKVGNETCTVISLKRDQVVCSLPKSQSMDFDNHFNEEYDILDEHENITVLIGDHFKQIVPKHQNSFAVKNNHLETFIIIVCIPISLVVITSFIIIGRKIKVKASQKIKDTQLQMDKLQLCVASECKEAFAELQTQISVFTSHKQCDVLPFLDYRNYVINILFPNVSSHSYIFYGKTILIHEEQALQLFSNLIKNRRFLQTFVRTLESNTNFSIKDRVFVASMIMITLQNDMEYCTDILKSLMVELIQKCTLGKSHPKLLFRRSESVAEKMLSAWLTFLLYQFLRENVANPLFNLFIALKQQVYKGPVDMITSDARYCLSENKMIRQKIDYSPMTVIMNISEKTAAIIKLKSAMEKVEVEVLSCDTISQVKEKTLDIIYNTNQCGKRPDPSEICIEWLISSSESTILTDIDYTSKIEGEWRQMNTLGHYGVPDGSTLNLKSLAETNHRNSDDQLSKILSLREENLRSSSLLSSLKRKKQFSESSIPLIQNDDDDARYKDWHLFKPIDLNSAQENHAGNDQIIPEIYLTRLLGVKNSLQNFVNDLFATILKKSHQNKCFPTAIKYMFDFLDDQALQHGITDPEIVHIWKNNCLPLRFWVNLIKNPNFLFDIHKSNTIDSCLSVIAQVLMDSCSTAELHLNKDSATSKLLYAKEISFYKNWVHKYYADIKRMPAVSPQNMSEMLLKESQTHATDFDTNSSVNELLKYALKHKDNLINALKADEVAQENFLAIKLEKVYDSMSGIAHF